MTYIPSTMGCRQSQSEHNLDIYTYVSIRQNFTALLKHNTHFQSIIYIGASLTIDTIHSVIMWLILHGLGLNFCGIVDLAVCCFIDKIFVD